VDGSGSVASTQKTVSPSQFYAPLTSSYKYLTVLVLIEEKKPSDVISLPPDFSGELCFY